MRRVAACALALSVLLLGPGQSAAQIAESDIAAVREHVTYANYPEAISSAQALLARADLTAENRNTLLELLATAQIANRHEADARTTLATLYARDPGHRLTDPDASPPVVSAFARAREAHPAAVSVDIEHEALGTMAVRESPVIVAQLGGAADAVDEVRLSYRHAGEPGYTRVVMNRRADGAWTGRIPVVGSTETAIDVAYFLTAVAPSGTELAQRGSDVEPLELRIPAETGRGIVSTGPTTAAGGGDVASEPVFWVLLGVVAVGAGVGIGVGVWLGTQGPEQGTLGTIRLQY